MFIKLWVCLSGEREDHGDKLLENERTFWLKVVNIKDRRYKPLHFSNLCCLCIIFSSKIVNYE
jgi:hypothetical protein